VRVTVRFYAGLGDRRAAEVELPAGARLADLFSSLGLDEREVHLVIVDGRIVHNRDVFLSDRARIALFPPVGGG